MKMNARHCLGAILALMLSPNAFCQDDQASQAEVSSGAQSTETPVDSVPNTSPSHPLAEYRNYDALTAELESLSESSMADLSSIGKTLEGRDIWLLTIGSEPSATKPAILVVGNVEAAHVAGSEIALRMAKQLVEGAESDPAIQGLLANTLVYLIPSPTPDATEKNVASGQREHDGNSVKTDDDRDFTLGEDSPIDLNGDGFITMMRIEDSLGTHRVHPEDSRVMIKVDPKKDETATHRLLVESQDHDKDGNFGEDAGDGVDFNRNFTFNYEYFGKNAGVNQVSEMETRAIVEFCFDHPNIAAVLSFSNQDNLFHPWKPSNSGDSARIKTSVVSADVPFLTFAAEQFQKLHGGKNSPDPASQSGSFSEWAYFHYGRWSFASRGWWIPEVKPSQEDAADKSTSENKSVEKTGEGEAAPSPDAATVTKDGDSQTSTDDATKSPEVGGKKTATEKRGQDELNALRWLASRSISGFTDWTPIQHPDFPDKVVEVGGFHPFVRSQPPVALLEEVVKPHVDFVVKLGELLPRIEFREPECKQLGSGYVELTVDLVNTSYLPTMSEMGSINGEAFPIVVQLELPAQATLIEGETKTLVRKLDGHGGKRELKWLLRIDGDQADITIPLTASAPTVATTTTEIEVE